MSGQESTGAVSTPPVETAPAVPEAPAVETPSVEATDVPLAEGKGKHAARTRARQRAEAIERRETQAQAARERALGQPRKPAGTPEGGEFAGTQTDTTASPAEGLESPPAATEPAAAAVPGAPAGDSKTTPSAAESKVPDGWVEIPIREGHPWRERGRTSIRALKEDEQEVRAAVNAAQRLRDAETRLEAVEREKRLLEARTEAVAGELPNYETDPKWGTLFKQVAEAEGFGPEMAEQLKEALKAKGTLKVRQAEDVALQEHTRSVTAHSIARQIHEQAPALFGVWTQAGETAGHVERLIPAYYDAVDKRNQQQGRDIPPSPEEFFQWAKQAYRADPRVQAEIKRIQDADRIRSEEQIRAQVRKEIEDDLRAKADEAARRRGTLPPTSRAIPASSTPVTEQQPERAAPRHGNHRKDAKARIRERYGAHPGTP